MPTLLLEEGHNFLLIKPLETVPDALPHAGDVHIEAAVTAHGFSGSSTFWIARASLTAFEVGLRGLEARRQGAATLEAMSPGEFTLRVEAVDRSGHMMIKGELARFTTSSLGTPLRLGLVFGFEIDAGRLPSLVRELATLTQFKR